MKKFVSILLVLVLMMSLSVAAFADGGETPSTANTSVTKVTINKTYVLENTGTTAPAETFNFTITPKSVTDAPTDVTAAPALNGGTGSIAFGAISATTTRSFDIDLSPINKIGVYTYEIKETAGATAGVDYDSTVITMVITAVTNENGSLEKYVAFYKGTDDKSGTGGSLDAFTNTYKAAGGSDEDSGVNVKKVVTGNQGDKAKKFAITITFTAPKDKTVKGDITYTVGEDLYTISAGEGWTDSKTATVEIAHNTTVHFINVPYGVSYNVTEADYTRANGGYDAPVYTYTNDTKVVAANTELVTVTNNKNVPIPGGVSMDSLPYILMLVVVGAAVVVIATRKKGEQF